MKQILVQDKNQAIAIDSMNVAKNIFRPFLVANYVDYDDDFKPIGGGQKAHDKYIQWYKTYLPIAQQAFTEAVNEMQKYITSNDESIFEDGNKNAKKISFLIWIILSPITSSTLACHAVVMNV